MAATSLVLTIQAGASWIGEKSRAANVVQRASSGMGVAAALAHAQGTTTARSANRMDNMKTIFLDNMAPAPPQMEGRTGKRSTRAGVRTPQWEAKIRWLGIRDRDVSGRACRHVACADFSSRAIDEGRDGRQGYGSAGRPPAIDSRRP